MEIYILFFAIILIIALWTEKNKYNDIKFKKNLVLISLIIAIFAAFRNENVGTDVKVYVKPLLELMPIYGFSTIYKTAGVEIAYVCLVWLVDFIGGNLSVLLFLLQIIPISLYMMLIYNERKNISILLAIFSYVTIFMGSSFNIMRQALAIAFVIHSYKYIKERNLKMFIFEMIIALSFHVTSVVFFPMYFIYGVKNSKFRFCIQFISIFVILILIIFFKDFLMLTLDWGMLPHKFSVYLEDLSKDKYDFPFMMFFIKLTFFVISYYYLLRKTFNKEEAFFFKNLLMFDMLFFFLGIKIMYAERITYYFSYLTYLYVIPKGITGEKNKNIQLFLLIAVYLIYFILIYGILGFGQIIPYKSILIV